MPDSHSADCSIPLMTSPSSDQIRGLSFPEIFCLHKALKILKLNDSLHQSRGARAGRARGAIPPHFSPQGAGYAYAPLNLDYHAAYQHVCPPPKKKKKQRKKSLPRSCLSVARATTSMVKVGYRCWNPGCPAVVHSSSFT